MLALSLLALLAPFSVVGSDLPTTWSLPIAVGALAAGMLTAWRYARQPTLAVVIAAGDLPVIVDGAPVHAFCVKWRGTLAFANWRDGGVSRRIALFPDTLDAPTRRALKLVMERRQSVEERVAQPGPPATVHPEARRGAAASVH